MESVSKHYAAMKTAIEKYTPHVDMELVDAGYQYAAKKHDGQLRKDGSPYIIHPLSVWRPCSTTASKTPMPAMRKSPTGSAKPWRIWWRASRS